MSRRKRLAIVGGGPTCTYVLERLAARVDDGTSFAPLEIRIFESSGEFGAGKVHSSRQPKSSFLNRIAGQVAFAADETVENSGRLLPPGERLTLQEWCREQFAETGDPDFDLQPEDWPKRYVHGLALNASFERSRRLLESHPSVTLHLHHGEVVDVVDRGGDLEVVAGRPDGGRYSTDHILFATGHSANLPQLDSRSAPFADFAARHGSTANGTCAATYVPSAYPLEEHMPDSGIGPDTVVACFGMGLTAIDIILYWTEGVGGTFDPRPDGRLVYRPSGAEPKTIVPFSGSGLFTFARPFNAKEKDLVAFEHRGVFLTDGAVDRLREVDGRPADLGHLGTRRQLDFERSVWPLLVLEMAFLYDRTLLGPSFGRFAEAAVRPVYDEFLERGARGRERDALVESLLAPLDAAVAEVAEILDGLLRADEPRSDEPRSDAEDSSVRSSVRSSARSWSLDETLARYLHVVFGPETATELVDAHRRGRALGPRVAERSSPFGHQVLLSDNLFSWRRTIEPIPTASRQDPESYRRALLEFMHRDHLWAAQDNLTNPAKAAADGVWRDLRPTLAHAADFGGLTADSHRVFLDVYMRHHNRLANGAALEVMEKIRALIECGLVDVSIGPRAEVVLDEAEGVFRVRGGVTGADVVVDCLIDAKVHPFDPERDVRPLYRNLHRRGLVRKWRNPGLGGQDFEPGGLDLNAAFHPVHASGASDRRLTFLGPPTEGVMFFQLGALRPQQNHHVMQDILCWLNAFWQET